MAIIVHLLIFGFAIYLYVSKWRRAAFFILALFLVVRIIDFYFASLATDRIIARNADVETILQEHPMDWTRFHVNCQSNKEFSVYLYNTCIRSEGQKLVKNDVAIASIRLHEPRPLLAIWFPGLSIKSMAMTYEIGPTRIGYVSSTGEMWILPDLPPASYSDRASFYEKTKTSK